MADIDIDPIFVELVNNHADDELMMEDMGRHEIEEFEPVFIVRCNRCGLEFEMTEYREDEEGFVGKCSAPLCNGRLYDVTEEVIS